MSNGIDPWVKTLLLKAAEDEAAIQIDEVPTDHLDFTLNKLSKS